MDNCSAHPSTDLTNISLHFLPPNVTSLIKLMDQGVIRNWKGHYRSTLNDRIITELDADENRCALTVARSINLLDALYIAYKSWKRVKQQTIQNIFKKAGFRRDDPTDDCEDDSSVDHALHDVAVPSNMTTDEFVDFVSCDDDIVIAVNLMTKIFYKKFSRRNLDSTRILKMGAVKTTTTTTKWDR